MKTNITKSHSLFSALQALVLVAIASGMGLSAQPITPNPNPKTVEYFAPKTNETGNVVPPAPIVPPGFTGVGPVVSGSVDFSTIPSKAKKFLQKHCDGHAVIKCEKEFTSGEYDIELADGIEMEFDHKGNLLAISAPDHYSLSPKLLKSVVPGKLYNLLDHNGFKSCVESVHHDNQGYRLDVADPVFDQVCYDPSGVLTLIVDH